MEIMEIVIRGLRGIETDCHYVPEYYLHKGYVMIISVASYPYKVSSTF